MKYIYKLILATALSFAASNLLAATIAIGSTLTLTGTYQATGGTDLADATTIELSTVNAAGAATGDFASTIGFPPPTGTGGIASIAPFGPVINFLTIGGWQLDLDTLNITDQTAGLLTLDGTGTVSGNGLEATAARWSFSGESPINYSMTIATVPVPAAVWLFGSGLIGLVGVARRKT